MLFRLAQTQRSAMASALGMARPARLQKPASSSLDQSSKAAGGVADRTAEQEGECTA
jgi:uncharacterized low-complexity protein